MDNLTFYSAAATVFPLLFITLTLTGEGMLDSSRKQEWWKQLWSLFQLLIIAGLYVGGEIVALRVLLEGHASDGQSEFVQTALWVAGGYVVVGVIRRYAAAIGSIAEGAVEGLLALGIIGGLIALRVF